MTQKKTAKTNPKPAPEAQETAAREAVSTEAAPAAAAPAAENQELAAALKRAEEAEKRAKEAEEALQKVQAEAQTKAAEEALQKAQEEGQAKAAEKPKKHFPPPRPGDCRSCSYYPANLAHNGQVVDAWIKRTKGFTLRLCGAGPCAGNVYEARQ